jgi:hypothetical protein
MNFKKGHKPWNKGKKWTEMSGKNNPMFGTVSPMRGKKLTAEQKQKISNSKIGKKRPDMVGKKYSLGKTPWNKGKKVGKGSSTSFKKGLVPWNKGKKWERMTREKNPNWKGTASLHAQIRKCFEYRQWRSDVFQRDNYTCTWCGEEKGGKINADHIKEFNVITRENNVKTVEDALTCEELWNINNGRTLCIKCHKIRHSKKVNL